MIKNLVNRRILKMLVLNGMIDELPASNTKKIEEILHKIIYRNGKGRWRNAKLPRVALRMLIENGVPLSFLKDNIGIIARNFVWEKTDCFSCYQEAAWIKKSDSDLCSINGEYIISSMDISSYKSNGYHSQLMVKGEELRNVKVTNRVGVVWTEVLQYYKYVQSQEKIIREAIRKINEY